MKLPWPFGHLWLKSLSVALAAMLWLLVSGDETVERGLRVPLEFQQYPEGLEMIGEPPALVDVRIRGASSTLSRLGPGDLVAQIDIKAARIGQRLYQLTPEQVRAPFGVQVVQVTPPSVTLVFEMTASKQVAVVPAVEGEPAAGYVVGPIAIDPPTVEVLGPQSSIARLTEATTEPVPVGGARATVVDAVAVGLVDSALRLKLPRRAQVRVEILPGPAERTIRQRPVRLRNLGNNLVARATPSGVDVVLRGSREGVNAADPDEVAASVDLSGLGAGDYPLPVRVESPQRAGVAHILPAIIQVNISRGKD